MPYCQSGNGDVFAKDKCCPVSQEDVLYCQSGRGAVLAAIRTAVLSAGIVAVLSGRDVPTQSGRGYTYAAREKLYFMYRRPTLYPLEIAVDFLKSP
jgi:hypothetical protein